MNILVLNGSQHPTGNYEYENSFLDYLSLKNMGIYTAFDKQNKSEDQLKELGEFGRSLS